MAGVSVGLLLALLLSPTQSRHCHRVQVPELGTRPVSVPVSKKREVQLDATFIFHGPARQNYWILNMTLMPQDRWESEVEILLGHFQGTEVLLAKCKNESEESMSFVTNPWLNSSNLNSSHTITLQVKSGEMKVMDERNTVLLTHNCSDQLKNFTHLALTMHCKDNTECGEAEYCWEECQILLIPPFYRPLSLPLHQTAQGLLSHMDYHPPLNSQGWVLGLAFTTHDDVTSYLGSVAIGRFQMSGQNEGGAVIRCDFAVTEDRTSTETSWYPNHPEVTTMDIRVLVGPDDILVHNVTAGNNTAMLHHQCVGLLSMFPKYKLYVRCGPGIPDCGSVKNCSNTGCPMVNMTQNPKTLHHHVTAKGKVEAEIHFRPPQVNITWHLFLNFKVADNDTHTVVQIYMAHTPGKERGVDWLSVECMNIKGKNKTYNNNNKNINEVFKAWPNFRVPLQSIRIKIGSTYLQLTEATAGRNTEKGNISCSFVPHFPNITMTLGCGSDSCGGVSFCPTKEIQESKQLPPPDAHAEELRLASLAIRMTTILISAAIVFGYLVVKLWFNFLNINLLDHLLPLVPTWLHLPRADN